MAYSVGHFYCFNGQTKMVFGQIYMRNSIDNHKSMGAQEIKLNIISIFHLQFSWYRRQSPVEWWHQYVVREHQHNLYYSFQLLRFGFGLYIYVIG